MGEPIDECPGSLAHTPYAGNVPCYACGRWVFTLAYDHPLYGRLFMLARHPVRPAALTMDGETGSVPIEGDPAWLADPMTIDGVDVTGYLGPEHEDVPPCCPAPTPMAP